MREQTENDPIAEAINADPDLADRDKAFLLKSLNLFRSKQPTSRRRPTVALVPPPVDES